ncbi:MAG: hypothetical protein LBT88_02340 [Oscillospiraceae bacterium]|jgi:hypothetical protein|nr:hypothetical protein [Oscillospiraceae bacterium]
MYTTDKQLSDRIYEMELSELRRLAEECLTAVSSQCTDVKRFHSYYDGKVLVEVSVSLGEDGLPIKEWRLPPFMRNICYENIESIVDTSIPSPVIRAKYSRDQTLAKSAEALCMLFRDESQRVLENDNAERIASIEGSVGYLIEWDAQREKPKITVLNTDFIVPQRGIWTDLEDMDYFFLRIPVSKSFVYKQYGIDVKDESEEDSKIGAENSMDTGNVTLWHCFWKSRENVVGLRSWVNDVELENRKNYYARIDDDGNPAKERIFNIGLMEQGIVAEVAVPHYNPNVYPVVWRKNVSKGKDFYGYSDVELIIQNQNTINRIYTRAYERLLRSGDILALPESANIKLRESDQVIYMTIQEKTGTNVITLSGDISELSNAAEMTYQHSRQMLGINDSYQGRRDSTATSGIAKQENAARTENRLSSRRDMKNAAFSKIYERIFKLYLAFSEDVIPTASDVFASSDTSDFSKYDYLEYKGNGTFTYNDNFEFDIDASLPLSHNIRQRWQEVEAQMSLGRLGDPAAFETRVIYWRLLLRLDYPDAGYMLKLLDEERARNEAAAQAQNQLPPMSDEQRDIIGAAPTENIMATPPDELQKAII